MRFSLKLPDDQPNPILTAKIPITVLNHPLLSTITATPRSSAATATDLSFSFSTSFLSGPSLKLSYSPTASAPFSISLKSGLGLFGSPRHSPLIFSANLSLSPSNPNPVPTFSLHFKPHLGDFSLRKTTVSNPPPHPKSDSGSARSGEFIGGFVPESPSVWEDLKLDHPKPKSDHSNGGLGFLQDRSLAWKDGGRGGFLSGVAVKARTALPVAKGLVVNLRWGVNLPADLGMKMPYLTVNKIGIERINEVKGVKEKKEVQSKVGDLELLKGMCLWMKSDLETLEKENREMRHCLEEMKTGASSRIVKSNDVGGRKKAMISPVENSNSSDQFEQWRSKKSVAEENSRKEPKKPVNKASDLENELQRAIKAAA